MSRRASRVAGVLIGAALVLAPGAVRAQSVLVGVVGSSTTLNEFRDDERRTGVGVGVEARVVGNGWEVEAGFDRASLSPSDDSGESVTVTSGFSAARWSFWRTLAAEVGFSNRSADPEFAVQDVAALSVGVHYTSRLGANADVWVRGALLPWSSFSGGGEAGPGLGVGLGVRIGARGSRLRGTARYTFERLDRTVLGVDVPLQFDRLRLGLEYAIF